MNIKSIDKYRTIIVEIKGDIDHHLAEEYREAIDKEFERTNSQNIVFDFSDIEFMDSSGIGMIIGRYKNAISKGGIVIVYGINSSVYRIFKISGLFKIIKCFRGKEDALESLAKEAI